MLSVEPELAKTVDDGNTPLMWLPDDDARAMEIARLLLDNGADPSIRNNEGKTAADRARERGLYDVADLLESTTPVSPAPFADHQRLEEFENLAKDLAAAYHGDADALERLGDASARSLTVEEPREGAAAFHYSTWID